MDIDIEITKGTYWGGSQFPYWVLLVATLVPITGMLGIDHLLLRSPKTALLKFLTLIPLLGFWYFFDVAQVLGEKEYVQKHGLAVPFFGPQGIGAGMFYEGNEKVSSPDIARPWRYTLYFLASICFAVFPINKIILGDYWAAAFQTLWYFMFPLTFLAVGWGLYDAYRLIFKPRDVFEQGAVRIPPATMLIDPTFNKTMIGPYPYKEDDMGILRLIRKYFFTSREVVDAGISLASMKARAEKSVAEFVPTVVGATTAATAGIAPAVSMAVAEGSMKLSQQVPELTRKFSDLGVDIGKSAATALRELPEVIKSLGPILQKEIPPVVQQIPELIKTIPGVDRVAAAAGNVAETGASAIKNTIQLAEDTAKSAAQKITNSAGEISKGVAESGQFIQKLPQIGQNVAGGITPEALLARAKVAAPSVPSAPVLQTGGSLMAKLDALPNSTHQKAIIIRNASDKIHDALVNLSEQVPNLLSTAITETGDIVVKGVESAVNKVQDVMNVIPETAPQPNGQVGGARAAGVAASLVAAAGLPSEGPSVSTSALLFSVALLAAGGFVMYTLRKALKAKNEIQEENDTPPDARDVRRTAQA
jgi:hypothetical protein